MPLIGITCSRVVGGPWGLYSPAILWTTPSTTTAKAVRFWGGAAVLIPAAQNRQTLQTILRRLDGLILSGGPDINPKFYANSPCPS